MWSFDGTVTDSNGTYNGQLVNGATYTASGSTNLPYFGNGRALSLTSSSSQYFLVSTPFLNLAYTSFTIEAWIYALSITGDNGIFTQCQCPTCQDQCFTFLIRGGHLAASFTYNGVTETYANITTSTWYHVAFVYSYETSYQTLYLNGYQDTNKSHAEPYQGTNGSILIGASRGYVSMSYFNGYIDNVKVATRAKSATEILNAATLIAHYPFDTPSPNNDNGPNGINGNSSNTGSTTGRVNQAMRFTGSTSFFQAYGFYQMGLGVVSNYPFSISMWINPSSNTTACTIV